MKITDLSFFINIIISSFAVGIFLISIEQTLQLTSNINKNGNKYPTYSLENMPKTSFTCRDKILGGYYADPETQCQMFHVCVKIAGVGVSYIGINFFKYLLQSCLIGKTMVSKDK